MEVHQWMCYSRLGIQAKGGFEMIHWSSHLIVLCRTNAIGHCSGGFLVFYFPIFVLVIFHPVSNNNFFWLVVPIDVFTALGDSINHATANDNTSLFVHIFPNFVNDQQFGLIGNRFDSLNDLFVVLLTNVCPIDLNNSVTFSQTGIFGWGAGVNFPDKLTGSGTLGMQIEAITGKIRSFHHMAKPGR